MSRAVFGINYSSTSAQFNNRLIVPKCTISLLIHGPGIELQKHNKKTQSYSIPQDIQENSIVLYSSRYTRKLNRTLLYSSLQHYTYIDDLNSFPNIWWRPTISSDNDPKLTQEKGERRSSQEEDEDEDYRGKKPRIICL